MVDTARQQVLNIARDAVARLLPNAWAIYVYGSFARGEERSDSDLDLAVLLPPRVMLSEKLALIAEISRSVGRDVDLVSLREANLDLVHELLRDGKQLLVRRPDDVLGWEAERMSDYADFNPRRAEIVSRYMSDPLRTPS